MLTFTVADIAAATGAVLVAGSGDVPVTSVVTDSRAAGEGDVVILSPAGASFDHFKNFAQRGKYFKEIVNGL